MIKYARTIKRSCEKFGFETEIWRQVTEEKKQTDGRRIGFVRVKSTSSTDASRQRTPRSSRLYTESTCRPHQRGCTRRNNILPTRVTASHLAVTLTCAYVPVNVGRQIFSRGGSFLGGSCVWNTFLCTKCYSSEKRINPRLYYDNKCETLSVRSCHFPHSNDDVGLIWTKVTSVDSVGSTGVQ